jgi:hypothetical protein
VGLVHQTVGGIEHDSINEIIYHCSDVINATEPVVASGIIGSASAGAGAKAESISSLIFAGLSRVQLRQADVLALDTLPASWADYDLILSASMLEYLPKQELPRALHGLRARLAPNRHMLVVITRKTLETKALIEGWWHAELYTREELLCAFGQAGFQDSLALLLAKPCKLCC